MKRYCFAGIFLCLSIFAAMPAQAADSTTASYTFGKISTCFRAGSYASVIIDADIFLKNHPFSLYTNQVLAYKAESLFYENSQDEAFKIFQSIEKSSAASPALKKKAVYWLGCILYFQNSYLDALVHFYPLVKDPFNKEEAEGRDLNKKVLLYTAHSLSALRRYEELLSLIEYYIKNYGDSSSVEEITSLLANLWLGMGIDAFEQKKFSQAKEYFKRSDAQQLDGTADILRRELSGFYQGIIYYNENNEGEALSLLQSRYIAGGKLELEYLSFLAIVYGEGKNWELCEQNALAAWKLASSLSANAKYNIAIQTDRLLLVERAAYWAAVCLFRKNSYAEAADILSLSDKTMPLSEEAELLYAQCLYASGKTEAALKLFTKRFPASPETAKALFRSGYFEQALKTAQISGSAYIEGLAAFQKKDWTLAAEKLLPVSEVKNAFQEKILFQESAEQISSAEVIRWSMYYAGLALYRQGKYVQAAQVFDNFVKENAYHAYTWNAYMLSALSALQQGKRAAALDRALAAVQFAPVSIKKQGAAMFAAGLYMEQKQYSKAAAILTEFSKIQNIESIPARLLLAQAYTASASLSAADDELKKIVRLFPESQVAREAAFKRGEIRYEAGEYNTAANLFKDFRLNFSAGVYSDAVLYFEALCREKIEDISAAVLLHSDLSKRYPQSPYRFAALKSLISLYRYKKEYSLALEIARQIRNEYPQEFDAAGLAKQIQEIEILTQEADEDTARTLSRWERAEKNNTVEGRKIGFELANLYLGIRDKIQDAEKLLLDLNARLKKMSGLETALHGMVLEVLARLNRERGNSIEAANFYLQAAECKAFSDTDTEKTARALYGALEALDWAGKKADALAVYKQMEEYHSQSAWTKRASALIDKSP